MWKVKKFVQSDNCGVVMMELGCTAVAGWIVMDKYVMGSMTGPDEDYLYFSESEDEDEDAPE